MSYLVIARKWRPQTFEDVVGQPHVVRTLQNAIRLDRIAHAYLFTGARGVGKTSIARILAKALNCEKGPAPSPCNECSNCREISQGNSVDVLEIDGASNRGIDSIRELRETVRYRPAKGRFKVYIIDEVHMLTSEAFNALLKTLEEPPPHVVFLFATTEPHKLPATILSRCQRFDFRRLTLPQLHEHLVKITSREGADFSPTVLYSIAREADGSMRDAQSLLEQLLAFSGDGLPDEEVLDILGVIDRQSVLRAGEAVLSGDAGGCLDLVEDLYRRGIDTRRFCQHLCDHFRNLLFVGISEDRAGRLDLPGDEKEFLKQQAAKTTPDTLHVYFQMLLRGEEEIRRSSMPRIALEMLLLRMAQLPGLESIDRVLDRIGDLERSLKEGFPVCDTARRVPDGRTVRKEPPQPPPVVPSREEPPREESQGPSDRIARDDLKREVPEPETAPEQGPPSPPEPVLLSAEEPIEVPEEPLPEVDEPSPAKECSAGEAADRWPEFLRALESSQAMMCAKLSHGRVVADGPKLELEIPDVYEKSVRDPDFVQKLNDAAQAFFGRRFDWVVKTMAGEPAAQGHKGPKPSGGKQIVHNPAVQMAIEILGAELIEVKTSKGSGPGRGGKATEPRS
ncbi:MAG: DNA polymerase III subunit gamma/tau [Desulfobacteraceae bacterium]|nr:DNA polymerase III subunit gamma/tau [Desulfobacteraceae bacterium]